MSSPAALLLGFVAVFFQAHFALAAIENSVIATGNFNGVPVVDTATESVDVIDAAPSLQVTKTGQLNDVDGNTTTNAGDTITYEILAENTGNISLTNIAIDDPLISLVFDAASDTDGDGNLDPFEVWRWTGTYTISHPDINDQGGGDDDIDNTVTVSSDELPDETATAEVPLAYNGSIDVSKAGVLNDDDGTPGPSAGDTIDYTITVTNDGSKALTSVVVNDPLISLTFIGTDAGSDSILSPTEVWTYEGTYILQQSDLDTNGGGDSDIDNIVTVTTAELPDETATVGVPIAPIPSLNVLKDGILNDDDGIVGVSAGDTIDYTVSVENTGNVSLTNVVVDDPLLASAPSTPMAYVSGDIDNDGEVSVGETWFFAGVYVLRQSDVDSDGAGDGNIENTASVTNDQTGITQAEEIIPLNIEPAMELTKVGVHNDDDGNPGLSDGDTLSYTVTVSNTGNIRLTNPTVSDPMLTLTYDSGDLNNDGNIDVAEIWSYTGTTILTQADIDSLGGGDGDIDNIATVNTDQLPPEEVSHELPIAPVSIIEIAKTTASITQLFPTIYEVTYNLQVQNTGVVTHTNIRVEDDLIPAIAPASIYSPPVVTVSGFGGTGGVNVGFNGAGDNQLLVGDAQLAPGQIALITITVVVDAGLNGLDGQNTAYVTSSQTTTPVPSDDPTLTPTNPNDVNPAPTDSVDADGDGSPDDIETTGDRDGDGINDAEDYDPTGYFYCQADGSILSGGLISVRNVSTGGTQTGIGTSNNITIYQDGSSGYYQFHVTAAGDYELFYTLPTDGVASTTLTSSGTLDVSDRTDNPAVIGSGEFGSTGVLADFTDTANPFYTRFSIEAGDPAVFNNNIPLTFCGAPAITADKTYIQTDGTNIEYTVRITASGNEQVNDVQLTDDLASVFGTLGTDYQQPIISINTAQTTATAPVSVNASFDGSADTELLTSGINLQAGEYITVNLTVPVGVAGTYTNTVVGSGYSPLTGLPVTPSSASAEVTFVPPINELVVEKSALPGAAPIGAPVVYTIRVTNPDNVDAQIGDIIDLIPNGMTYVPGSATLNGVASEPLIVAAQRVAPSHTTFLDHGGVVDPSGRELVWENITIPADSTVEIQLTLIINAAAADGEYINHAFVRDDAGELISNIATARVELEIEPVFQCSDLIGRVFDDLNRDGYHDEGEPGLAGVRLATPRGLLITTDKFGRYHIACGAIPDEDIGSNFIMKLDTRTLPSGYKLTSENPRVVRLTRGKLAKLNFAAANLRVVRLELTDGSFKQNSTGLTKSALQSIAQIFPQLDEEPSILKIRYRTNENTKVFARERLLQVEGLLEQAWTSRNRNQELNIQTQILKR